jgi:hypothetical protein
MLMGKNLEDIARLEPAVRSAMKLRGSTGAVVSMTKAISVIKRIYLPT